MFASRVVFHHGRRPPICWLEGIIGTELFKGSLHDRCAFPGLDLVTYSYDYEGGESSRALVARFGGAALHAGRLLKGGSRSYSSDGGGPQAECEEIYWILPHSPQSTHPQLTRIYFLRENQLMFFTALSIVHLGSRHGAILLDGRSKHVRRRDDMLIFQLQPQRRRHLLRFGGHHVDFHSAGLNAPYEM